MLNKGEAIVIAHYFKECPIASNFKDICNMLKIKDKRVKINPYFETWETDNFIKHVKRIVREINEG